MVGIIILQESGRTLLITAPFRLGEIFAEHNLNSSKSVFSARNFTEKESKDL
jgi:hypothetical protein